MNQLLLILGYVFIAVVGVFTNNRNRADLSCDSILKTHSSVNRIHRSLSIAPIKVILSFTLCKI